MTFLVILLAYVLSVLWCKRETEYFFRNLKHVKAEFFDVVTCFIPIINLIQALVYVVDRPLFHWSFLDKVADKFFKSNKGK